MGNVRIGFIVLFFLGILAGCSSAGIHDELSASRLSYEPEHDSKRFVIKSASIKIEVANLNTAANEIINIVERESGFIDNTHNYDQQTFTLTVKIPEAKLESFVDDVAAKGKLISKSFNSRDVTNEIIDIEARLKNLIALRERFRSILVKAEKVSEILEIEKELSRIQSEIDAIEGRRKSLQHQVALSKVDITIKQKIIYGPLAYLGIGLYWIVEKLFVIK